MQAMNLLAVIRENGEEIAVGMVQYVADPYPSRGEFAAAVADAWQRRGIATRLLRNLICIARTAGVEHLQGDILSENEAMIGLMVSMGFDLDLHPDGAHLMTARKEVVAPAWTCSPLTGLVTQRRAITHA
jgi:acetyltransferase